ncbi:hypothetical protein [Streptomyces adelaidensis]|uniref:hypothetical protein n=1 Tax=Streptomyces adelaidensis TaxID=2796465 RepID=UPI0019073CD1|nr:hypothetical protein [Streptomyces adelaidensis]
MPYVYRCRQCRAASLPGTRYAAESARQTHRDSEHGGLAPDGERIEYVSGGARHPDGRYVSTAAVLVLLALLALAECAARVAAR